MLRTEALRDVLAGDLKIKDRLLVLLAVDATEAKSVSALKQLGCSAGWRGVDKVNVSAILGRVPKLAARTSKGWELTSNGRKTVSELVAENGDGIVIGTIAPALRSHLVGISNADARAFVEEAVKAYEARLFRAAVVLSWVGAVAVLYDHMVANHLAAFNAEATRRQDPKRPWKTAANADDLARMKEHDFLEILTAISVPGIGKNVKEELQKQLKLRNACGHPNGFKLGEHVVAAHIEVLIMNVFSKF